MSEDIVLKDDYTLAKCCSPVVTDSVIGYYSHDNNLKVHRTDCSNLAKVEPQRLVQLEWDEITEKPDPKPEDDYKLLESVDFRVMEHHRAFGIDYSLMVAKVLSLSKQVAFERHRKLRDLGLLERVEALMVQYRKGIADHKWIKHRNHTYYQLTAKGKRYLTYYERESNAD